MTHFVLFATITAVAAKNSVGSPPDGIYPNAKKDYNEKKLHMGQKARAYFSGLPSFHGKSVDVFYPREGETT